MRSAYGFGVATTTNSGEVLDTWYLDLGIGALKDATSPALDEYLGNDELRGIVKSKVGIEIDLDVPPANVSDAYLRLHLLSHRIVKPHGLNLDGIFGILNNVVWTSVGPCSVATFNKVSPKLRAKYGSVTVYGVDKFPRMVDYVVPEGVRIADADRVRLGAHLASGTTIMHEGFVNFNAGTLGKLSLIHI